MTTHLPRGPNKRGFMGFDHAAFDYGQLAANLADDARAAAGRINTSKRTHIIEVGLELTAMKEKMAHGQFTDWIDRALQFTPATARNYMRAAAAFEGKTKTVFVLPPATLYRLAGTTDDVKGKIVERIEAGEHVDREEVENAIDAHRKSIADARRLAKKSPEARRQELREKERRQEQWRVDEAQRDRQHKAAAMELVHALSMHFEADDIAQINALWTAAGPNAVDAALTILRNSNNEEVA